MPASFTVDRFLHLLPQATTTRIEIDPKARGWEPVGHVDAFRPHHQNDAWPPMMQWIKYGVISGELKGDRWDSSSAQHCELPQKEITTKM